MGLLKVLVLLTCGVSFNSALQQQSDSKLIKNVDVESLSNSSLVYLGRAGNKEIYFDNKRMDWFAGTKLCHENGMKLLQLRSAEEAKLVKEIIADKTNNMSCWTGLIHDLDLYSQFKWIKGSNNTLGYEYDGPLNDNAVGFYGYKVSNLLCLSIKSLRTNNSNFEISQLEPCGTIPVSGGCVLCQNNFKGVIN